MGVRHRKRFGMVTALRAALLGVAIVAPCATGAAPVPRARNVVVISVDTLRADVLQSGAFGTGVPPTLAGMAQHAATFPHAYSTAAWTLPAHASLMTGLYPDRHGATHPDHPLAPDAVTLAGVLHAHGFETLALTGGGYVDRNYGFGAGFDEYDGFVDPSSPYRPRPLPRHGALNPISIAERFDRAIAYLRQHQRGDPPFFLFLHTFAVHDYFRDRASADHPLASLEHEPASGYVDCLQGRATCLPSEWALLRDRYCADVGYLDGDLARLLRVLTETGLRQSTLVVLTADHGEGFDPARQRIHHGGRLHADVVRVPLLFDGPGIAPGPRRTPASLVDVMPTILTYLDLPTPAGLDGVALPLAARDDRRPARVLYAMEHFYFWSSDGTRQESYSPDTPLLLAVITPDRWYIRTPGGEELYAQSDLDQRDDLVAAGEAPDELRRLAGARSAAPGQVAGSSPHTIAASHLDGGLAERLRALGYPP